MKHVILHPYLIHWFNYSFFNTFLKTFLECWFFFIMYHRSVGTTVTTPPVMRVADTNVFLSTDFWCCLPECFFQLCGELAYLMVFCLPLPLSSGVLLDFVCYIIDLTLLTTITMFYCLKFLSVSEDTTLICSSWRFVCRSKSLFDLVPVFFDFSLIILPLGIS